MFLEKTMLRNPALIDAGFSFHQRGEVLPDSYLIDVDTFVDNARKILEEAKKQDIRLYFMLKQVGRNPYLAQELVALGYDGAVVVDFKEAQTMMKHHIPICNVGHLVQTPYHLLGELIAYGCTYFTVFSIEKIRDINQAAAACGKVQKLLLKVVDKQDMIYSGQSAGFWLEDLKDIANEVKTLENVEIQGVTSFPCFLYHEDVKEIQPTPNFQTLLKAKEILSNCGIEIENINAPSTTSIETLRQMKPYGIHSGEPGHGMSGTTPLHASRDCEEVPAVIYVSEISHNFDKKAYCYGGGFYRRSHVSQAIIGRSRETAKRAMVETPALDSIDYYFGLSAPCRINDTVIMAFRFQIFATRSNVVLIKGLAKQKPVLAGTYTSLGERIL